MRANKDVDIDYDTIKAYPHQLLGRRLQRQRLGAGVTADPQMRIDFWMADARAFSLYFTSVGLAGRRNSSSVTSREAARGGCCWSIWYRKSPVLA
jgi:hypothetical protein